MFQYCSLTYGVSIGHGWLAIFPVSYFFGEFETLIEEPNQILIDPI
jgi:hypothetical protein